MENCKTSHSPPFWLLPPSLINYALQFDWGESPRKSPKALDESTSKSRMRSHIHTMGLRSECRVYPTLHG